MIMRETNTSIAENEKKAAVPDASRTLPLVKTRDPFDEHCPPDLGL